MKNYQCTKCSVSVKGDSTPNYAGCPKGGHHQWTDLGEVGIANYQCKKCGILVQSKSTPNYAGCPSSGHHQWNKL